MGLCLVAHDTTKRLQKGLFWVYEPTRIPNVIPSVNCTQYNIMLSATRICAVPRWSLDLICLILMATVGVYQQPRLKIGTHFTCKAALPWNCVILILLPVVVLFLSLQFLVTVLLPYPTLPGYISFPSCDLYTRSQYSTFHLCSLGCVFTFHVTYVCACITH